MIHKSESITEIAKAMCQFQKDLRQPLKDAANPYFNSKYVPLENVTESITETASKYGLSFTQFPTSSESGLVEVGTLIMHESGEWMEFEPLRLKPVKNDPQAIGSAVTYGRRYALSAIFGVTSDEDDDGNKASQTQISKKNSKTAVSHSQSQTSPLKVAYQKLLNQGFTKEEIGRFVNDQAKERKLSLTDDVKISLMNELSRIPKENIQTDLGLDMTQINQKKVVN